MKDDEPVRDTCGVVHAVGDEQDGGAGLAAVIGYVFEYSLAAGGVEPGSGLVEDEDLGPHCDDSRYGYAPLLPAGELQRGLLEEVLGEPDEARRLADPLVHLALGELHVLGAEGDIPVYRLLKELVLRVLEHEAHLEAHVPRGLLRCEDIHVLAENAAGGGLQQSVQVLDEGALA